MDPKNPTTPATQQPAGDPPAKTEGTRTAGTPPANQPVASDDATRAAAEAATKAERERIAGIRQAVRAAKLEDGLADELVNSGVSLDKARAAVLDKLASADEQVRTEQHVRVDVGEEAHEKFVRGATAWLLAKSAAVGKVVAEARTAAPAHAEFANLASDPGEFRGFTLVDLARESLERRGVRTRGLGKLELVGKAFTHRSGFNTTSDFGVLLESVMRKTLLGAYVTTQDTWPRFCRVDSVADFRTHHRYRLGTFGVLDALNEHGEFKQKAIPDGERASVAIKTIGNITGLTRQAIINDDMGAFASLAEQFGRAAKLSIEVAVFNLIKANGGLGPTLADGLPLFDAAHRNIGAAAALSVASLDADAVVMASQTDVSGNEILDIRPAVLLVPRGLEGQAKVLNTSAWDPASNKLQVPNHVAGMFSDVVGTARLTGTRRYLFADTRLPVLEVDFLDGQREPVLEVQDGWRIDGTEWKVRLDFGVTALDFRGAVTNAGAGG